MNLKAEVSNLFNRIPTRKVVFLGILLAWFLLSTVLPVPAPPGGGEGDPPD